MYKFVDVNPESLRDLRIRGGLSQEELADVFDVSKKTIQGYEQGVIAPSLKMLYLYSAFFDVVPLTNHLKPHPNFKEAIQKFLNRSEYE